jgi:hypothetical protein
MAKLAVKFQRDLRRRVVSIGTGEARTRFAEIVYRPDGSIAAKTLAGGLRRTTNRDALRRLTTSMIPPCRWRSAIGKAAGRRGPMPMGW